MKIVDYASPNITLEEWSAGRKTDLDVFEDQIQGWVFDQVDTLLALPPHRRQHSGYALLALVTPYFEMIACYLEGRRPGERESSKFLRQGLAVVLDTRASSDAINAFAKEVRNGIAHELMFRYVILHDGAAAYPSFGMVRERLGNILAVDPYWLARVAHDHFRGYTTRIRHPQTDEDRRLGTNFASFIAVRKAPPPVRR